MLAIVNPIGLIPIWKEMTADASPAVRKRLAYMVTGTSVVVLLIFLLLGQPLLNFFSIDVAVFKIAGGLLLLLTAISMVNGSVTQLHNREEQGNSAMELAKKRFKKVLVPLSVPMLSGPGSITTVLLYSAKADGMKLYISFSVILLLVFGLLCLVFAFSYLLEHRLDDLFFVGFTRVFGLVVAAIAMQFVVEGLGDVFPALVEAGSVLKSKQPTQ